MRGVIFVYCVVKGVDMFLGGDGGVGVGVK